MADMLSIFIAASRRWGIEACLLGGLLRAVSGGVGAVENHRVRLRVFFQVDFAFCRPGAIDAEVEIDDWLAFAPESVVRRPRLDFCDGLYCGHFHSEFCGHFLKIAFGKASSPQAFVGRKQADLYGVAVHHHEVFGHHIVPDGLEQEALAAAVPANDEAEGGPAAGDDVHVVEEGIDLRLPAHGDVGQAHPGHYAALQGVHQCLGNSSGYFHGRTISFKSSV